MSTHIGGIRLERTDQLKLQKAVKDETVFVALGSIILSVIMVIVFFVLHRVFPERVPMDLPVIIQSEAVQWPLEISF